MLLEVSAKRNLQTIQLEVSGKYSAFAKEIVVTELQLGALAEFPFELHQPLKTLALSEATSTINPMR